MARVKPQLHLDQELRIDSAFSASAGSQGDSGRTVVKLQTEWLLQQQQQQEYTGAAAAASQPDLRQILSAIDAV
jgi:hypothetical protein